MSSLVVHIPDDLEIHPLKEVASNHGLTITESYSKTKSFTLKGSDEQITNFVKVAEEYKQFGVHTFDSSPLKHVTHGIKPENVVPLDLAPEQATYFNSAQLAQIYGVSQSASSQRVNIAIIELGGGYVQSDLDYYFNTVLGLKTIPNVIAVGVDGGTNAPGNGADFEVALDIQAVAGVCPNSNIVVYFAPNSYAGFVGAIQAAANSTAYPTKYISISWAGNEQFWSSNAIQPFNSVLQQVANSGITVCVSSGDGGSNNGQSSPCVNFPSSSPNVLCVGGTHLVAGANYTYGSETGWGKVGNNNYGSGGGQSVVFGVPSYQIGVVPSNATGRCLPDISADADPSTGMLVYLRGQLYLIGGTSLSAPLLAATLASIGYKSFLNPNLYKIYALHSNIVHDVTAGTNGVFNCGPAYDLVTGIGSPNGPVLASLLSGCGC